MVSNIRYKHVHGYSTESKSCAKQTTWSETGFHSISGATFQILKNYCSNMLINGCPDASLQKASANYITSNDDSTNCRPGESVQEVEIE